MRLLLLVSLIAGPALAGGPTPENMKVEVELFTTFGDIVSVGQRVSGSYSVVGGDLAARHLLTITAAGDVRYTIHYGQGPQSVTYLGKC